MAKEQSNREYSTSNVSYVPQILPFEAPYKEPNVTERKTEYARNKELSYFLGQPMRKGTYLATDSAQQELSQPALFYSHPNGEIWIGDVVDWMLTLGSESVDLIFADPPYNIKKAEWDTFESQQEYVNWSLRWIEQAARVLKPTGTLYICGFSEILADLKLPASRFFTGCRWIIWHYKNKANLGNDWGARTKAFSISEKAKNTYSIQTMCVSLMVIIP